MNTQVIRIDQRRFDASLGRPFAERMRCAWESGANAVVLDFTDVVSIDSLGVSILIAAERERPRNGRIVICALRARVREAIEICRLHRSFDIYRDASAALRDSTPPA